MGTKYAERAVVRDQGLNQAFQEGFGEAREEGVEYLVTLITGGHRDGSQVFIYMDGALAWAAEHLRKGTDHDVRIDCRAKTPAPVPELTGDDEEDDGVVDAEIVEE